MRSSSWGTLTSLGIIAILVILLACSSYLMQLAGKSNEPDTSHHATMTFYSQVDAVDPAGSFLYVSPSGNAVPGVVYFDTCPNGPIRCAYIGYVKGSIYIAQTIPKGGLVITDSEDLPSFRVSVSLNGSFQDVRFDLEQINGGYFTTGCYRKKPESKEATCLSVTQ